MTAYAAVIFLQAMEKILQKAFASAWFCATMEPLLKNGGIK